jgi:glyoxylase-like metal-dependent hydrolase (beta-lactamase superfamily II)
VKKAAEAEMHVSKLKEHISIIDVETAGIKDFIASYVLKGQKTGIIETGPTSSVPNLLLGLKKLHVKPEEVAYVAVSHIHLDHGGGVGTLIKSLPNAKVIVHRRGAPHLANPEKLWQQSREVLERIADWYGQPEPVPRERIIDAADGMAFDLGDDVAIEVVETLGHASHHQSYYETFGGGVFPGDAAGVYINKFDLVVPTTPAPFRLDEALASLDKLIALEPKALYYSHFGEAPNPVGKLRSYADQLKLWVKIAEQELEKKQGFDAIREKIVASDPNVRKAIEFIKVHPILSETVLVNSIQGAIDSAQKHMNAAI